MSGGLKGYLDPVILAILSDVALHGYAVIEELKARSGGELDLPEGTVYPALHRLERRGLLKSGWTRVDVRRRRAISKRHSLPVSIDSRCFSGWCTRVMPRPS